MNSRATFNSFPRFAARLSLVLGALFLLALAETARPGDVPARENPKEIAARNAGKAFTDARARLNQSRTADHLREFAQAAFDWAEFARNDRQREDIAQQGITAARELVRREPNLAAAHYYLGMNLGQLARSKLMAGLGLVREMEELFIRARALDPLFDYAGPDRNLGLIYFEAPGWPLSIGNRAKAREHLIHAVELNPQFPENPLNLIEAYLKWNERAPAQRQLLDMEERLPDTREQFQGDQWAAAWLEWEARLEDARRQLAPPKN